MQSKKNSEPKVIVSQTMGWNALRVAKHLVIVVQPKTPLPP